MAFLHDHVLDTMRASHHEITFVSYLDDRNAVVTTPQAAAVFIEAWQTLSARLGMQENLNKLRIVVKDTPSGQNSIKNTILDLLPFPLPDAVFATSCRVLGIEFAAQPAQAAGPVMCQRLKSGEARARKVRCAACVFSQHLPHRSHGGDGGRDSLPKTKEKNSLKP